MGAIRSPGGRIRINFSSFCSRYENRKFASTVSSVCTISYNKNYNSTTQQPKCIHNSLRPPNTTILSSTATALWKSLCIISSPPSGSILHTRVSKSRTYRSFVNRKSASSTPPWRYRYLPNIVIAGPDRALGRRSSKLVDCSRDPLNYLSFDLNSYIIILGLQIVQSNAWMVM